MNDMNNETTNINSDINDQCASCHAVVSADRCSDEDALKLLIQNTIVDHTDHQMYISAEEIAYQVINRPAAQQWTGLHSVNSVNLCWCSLFSRAMIAYHRANPIRSS